MSDIENRIDEDVFWLPKLTSYRILFISLSLSFGFTKAVVTYLALSVASVTIEWISGILVFTLLYILGIYEESYPCALPSFFVTDRRDQILRLFGLAPPRIRPITEELSPDPEDPWPLITGYRLLISGVVVLSGAAKAALSYKGQATSPTTIEWLFGTFVSTSFYWLGLYESSSAPIFLAFFKSDYGPHIKFTTMSIFRLCLVLLQLGVIAFILPSFKVFFYDFQLVVWFSKDRFSDLQPVFITVVGSMFAAILVPGLLGLILGSVVFCLAQGIWYTVQPAAEYINEALDLVSGFTNLHRNATRSYPIIETIERMVSEAALMAFRVCISLVAVVFCGSFVILTFHTLGVSALQFTKKIFHFLWN